MSLLLTTVIREALQRVAERSTGQVLALACGLLLTPLAILGIFGHLVATGWQPLIMATAFAPYLMAMSIPAAVLLLVGTSRLGALALLVVFVASVVLELPQHLGHRATSGFPVTVMTSNLRLGNGSAADIVREVKTNGVEILMLEEVTKEERARLRTAGLDALLPHVLVDTGPDGQGTGIWSRYRLTDSVKYSDFVQRHISAHCILPFGWTVQLFAVHPIPPFPYPVEIWLSELPRLKHILQEAPPGPVIVGGDFNATYDHPQFRALLTGGYRDAAKQVGAGMVRTYPADQWYPPLIGIDHILLRGASASSVRTATISNSDHRAVIASIRLPN